MCGLADETGSAAGETEDDEARQGYTSELRARQRRVEREVADRDRHDRKRPLGKRSDGRSRALQPPVVEEQRDEAGDDREQRDEELVMQRRAQRRAKDEDRGQGRR